MKSKKIKLGLEILLMVVILGMIYKLATNDDVQDKVQNSAVEQALESGEISSEPVKASTRATAAKPKAVQMDQKKAQDVANEIMQQTLSPTQRGDFGNLN